MSIERPAWCGQAGCAATAPAAPTRTPPASPPPPYSPYHPEVPTPAPPGPHVQRSAVGIAVGSAAAATVLLALAFYLLMVALRRRRVGRLSDDAPAAAAAPTVHPVGGSSEKLASSAKAYPLKSAPTPQEPEFVCLSPAPPPGTTSDDASSESSRSHGHYMHPHEQHPGKTNVSPDEMLLFRGTFAYEKLAAATNGFADPNLVGRGGFGDVYVGEVDGAAVAVKRLRAGSQQGDREFRAEVRTIGRVHHRNLVSLLGYCVADGGQRLLVYEFVPNMTLEHHLHGGVQTILDWPTRWKIAVGAAKGLAYLHEDCHPRIIHRDMKPANILLDTDFNPKVSDFGMAKFIPGGDTHVSTRIVGTIGYLAPEYASSGRFTEKCDVFSYGVVVLELITGMSASISSHPDTDDTLVAWAMPLLTRALELEHSSYNDLVDPLLPSFDTDRMERLIRCAMAAVHSSAWRRPRMSQIVRHLEGDAWREEIDVCGATSSGERGSADGDTVAHQFHSMRYSEIRMSRRGASGTIQRHR